MIPRFTAILAMSTLVWAFFHAPQPAEAQVGVIPEGEAEKEFSEVTFKLIGVRCDSQTVKWSILKQDGVIDADTETKRGHVIVYYFPEKVTPEELKGIIKRNKECFTSLVPPTQENGNSAGTVGEAAGGKEENTEENKQGSSP